jgi:Fe-S cluster biogenesis protein NfuA
MDERIPAPGGNPATTSAAPTLAALDEALVSVRQRLRGHAGDVTVAGIEDGVVTLDYQGACRGCPAVNFTHIAVVEPALGTVEGVRSVAPPRSDIAPAVLKRIRAMMTRHAPVPEGPDAGRESADRAKGGEGPAA